MSNLKDQIIKEKLPKHIAIIMDGNGRWAQQRGELRTFGHHNAVVAVRDTVEGAAELGIKCLTLFAFSTENWNRPTDEVNTLMELLVTTINKELDNLNQNNIVLSTIGDLSALPKKCQDEMLHAIETTKSNTGMIMNVALSYSSKWEIIQATKEIAKKVAAGELAIDNITDAVFEKHLTTHGLPEPDLLIRTSGEYRISNFLLWQIAYAELYFTKKLWPDFRKEDLYEAIIDFQNRERRFGKTSEQINK